MNWGVVVVQMLQTGFERVVVGSIPIWSMQDWLITVSIVFQWGRLIFREAG